MSKKRLYTTMVRIAEALERLTPSPQEKTDLNEADAFIWHSDPDELRPVEQISRISLDLLKGIDSVRDILKANTEQFAQGFAANNALLWGARGMGKSSLVKALQAHVRDTDGKALALIEIHREDIPSMPRLLNLLKKTDRRCILFCDDLSFDEADSSYKSLKAILEGGLEGRPDNVIFYATSNRRHLMPRHMMENERSTAINPAEVIEEKLSLSDRFGLWLGFHSCSQDEYLSMIRAYHAHYKLPCNIKETEAEALSWSRSRGARSGRVAWQFIQDLAGRLSVKL